MDCAFEEFAARLTAENHTLKRSLTDPHILSGIGNAYSDEILHHAQLGPVTPAELARLLDAVRDRLRLPGKDHRFPAGNGGPRKVQPALARAARIVHGSHQSNYCPACQTGGKLLADRARSRLLGRDWPKSLEVLQLRKHPHRK